MKIKDFPYFAFVFQCQKTVENILIMSKNKPSTVLWTFLPRESASYRFLIWDESHSLKHCATKKEKIINFALFILFTQRLPH